MFSGCKTVISCLNIASKDKYNLLDHTQSTVPIFFLQKYNTLQSQMSSYFFSKKVLYFCAMHFICCDQQGPGQNEYFVLQKKIATFCHSVFNQKDYKLKRQTAYHILSFNKPAIKLESTNIYSSLPSVVVKAPFEQSICK